MRIYYYLGIAAGFVALLVIDQTREVILEYYLVILLLFPLGLIIRNYSRKDSGEAI